MTDREKVIKGLRCIKGDFIPCASCKYASADGYGRGGRCKRQCAGEAIALMKKQEEQIKNRDESLDKAREEIKWLREMLKEQEPRVMTRLEIEQSKGRIVWFEDDQFNSYALVDGIDQRNSWVWLSTVGNMCLQQRRDCENYGKRWRCWTKRPTEDQRKAVKCE